MKSSTWLTFVDKRGEYSPLYWLMISIVAFIVVFGSIVAVATLAPGPESDFDKCIAAGMNFEETEHGFTCTDG